jgi:hypothetical protein
MVADVTNASDDLTQIVPDYPGTIEDLRATATAFSQLTGVLGGFSITILVLILGLLGENKAARDWTVALLLFAATAYIYRSGILANSMNVSALARAGSHPMQIRETQQHVFNHGIEAFHVGNIFLPAAVVVTVYQESLWVGLAASALSSLLAAQVIRINILRARHLRRLASAELPSEAEASIPETPGCSNAPTGGGLGWPDINITSRREHKPSH